MRESPQAAVLGPDHVADRFARVVGQAVDGQRGGHRVRRRVVERDQADGRADEAGQPLRDHAVELRGLRDERPVAPDLVQQGQVARARLGLSRLGAHLVVQRLEAQEGPHLEDEGGRVDRLLQEVVRARVVALAHGGRIAEGGQHDDGQRGAVGLADARAGLEAVHARAGARRAARGRSRRPASASSASSPDSARSAA